jgi:serine/threonine protein kinase/tetratricopeptide (TPR) repeat protein
MSDLTSKGVLAKDGDAELPRRLGGFTLLSRIAEGKRGDVFAALRAANLDRFCAVKLLPPWTTGRQEIIEPMRAEAPRLVKQIHANVVPIYDVAVADDRLMFVSELPDGGSLEALLRGLGANQQTCPIAEAVFIATEIAAAAAYLRRTLARAPETARAPLRLVPRSVLVSVEGDVKLIFLGAALDRALVAASPASLRESGGVPVATLRATSPGGDAQAVAVLLGQMLTGRLQPDTTGNTPPPAPMRQLPEALEHLLRSALAKDPAARPRDCEELRAALITVLRDLSPDGPPPLGELLRHTLGDGRVGDRARLKELADRAERAAAGKPDIEPAGGAKVITLTRLEDSAAGDGVAANDTAAPGTTEVPAVPGARTATVDLGPGQVIPGTRYRILSKIGEGGMGSVYAAEHVDLEKKVAVKVLRADVAPDDETLQQFRQEARAASKIGNLYICDVTDFGEVSDGRVFFVMEYLDGISLARVLKETPTLPPGRAIAILRQVAKALGAAHDKGIVHLDVKPDNVMLVQRGKRDDAVKVVDFGIAGLMHQSAEELEIAGTPEYVAPERASGKGYDSRCDIYGLGITAYEMLAGSVPFHGKNHLTTLTMQVKEMPEPLRKRAPKVPAELEAVIMNMLEKDPAARPQSMAAVEALLCEAQISAGLSTSWDDLELPAVDEVWRLKLAKRMPSAGARARRMTLIGATAVAVVAATLALFFGLRKPKVVVKEVRVEVTNTQEAAPVAAALVEADKAARHQLYVEPPDTSALHFIQVAEIEASKIDLARPSPGAAALRRAYASALAVIGNELLKAGLRDLAVVKFKEALLFQPDDPELAARAELTPEERRNRAKSATATAAATAPPPRADPAKEAATRVFLAAMDGRVSEARLALRTLGERDSGGAQSAKLADGLRNLAGNAWNKKQLDRARPLYQLISELDPLDQEARDRAKPGSGLPPPAPTPAAVVGPVAPPAPAPAAPPAPAPKTKKRDSEPGGASKSEPPAPRDSVVSQKAAAAGQAALARGRLAEAEENFNRAVRADSTNPIAVGGLAEVAFEHARYAEALDYARRASRLAPQSSKYLVVLGDAYFKLLRYDEAKATYQKARALAPKDEGIKTRLDRVQSKLGTR